MPELEKTGGSSGGQLADLMAQRAELSKKLQNEKRNQERETENILKARRNGVAADYDRQLRTLEGKIRTVSGKRQKARSQGVKARIQDRTESLRTENAGLQKELRSLFRDNQVPAFCRTGAFYAWTMPRSGGELLTAALSFGVVFLGIPFLLYWLLGLSAFWHWALLYLFVILVFGGIWIGLISLKGRHLAAMKEGRSIRSRILANKRSIRKISRKIRRDRDDGLYDLQSFDDELAQYNQEKESLKARRAEALEQFDTVTKNVLTDEVAEKYKDRLRELSCAVSETDRKIKEFEEKMKNDGKTGDGPGDLSGS